MITAFMSKPVLIAGAVGIGVIAGLTQTVRLQSAQAELERVQQSLRTCSANLAHMETRRAIEDDVAREPSPADRLRDWQRQ